MTFLFFIGWILSIVIIIWLMIPETKKGKQIFEVYIHDKYYDLMINEDIPTIVKVIYNQKGDILDVNFSECTSDLCDCESSQKELDRFYKTCGIDVAGGVEEWKKYTIYDHIQKELNI